MADKINRLILQTIVDKTSLANAKTELNSIRQQMTSYAADAKKSELATVAAGKSIRESFGSQSSARIASFQGKMADAVTSTKGLTSALNETEKASGFLGKLQNFQSKAAVLGRELKALPAVNIGSSGLSTDAIGKLTQVFGKLPPAALGAGVALAAVAIALKVASDAAAAQAAAQKRANEVQAEVTRAVITSTKEELQLKLEAARIEKAVQLSLFNQRIATLNELEQRESTANAIFGREIVAGAETLGLYAGDIKQQREDVMATSEALTEASQLEKAYEEALNQGATAKNDAIELEKQLEEARRKATERGIQYILDETKFQQDAAKFTEKQNEDRRKSIQDQIALITQEIQLRQQSGDASKENTDRLNELAIQFAALGQQEAFLAGAGLELARANDAAIESEKKRADTVSAIAKYNEDLIRLEEQYNQQRAAIEERYGETLVKIAERAAEQAENALQKLQEKRADLVQDIARAGEDAQREAQRDELDAQIEFQQDEAKAARDHARNLADIRRRAQEEEQDLALNRDFAGLFQLQRDTNRELDDANRAYQEQRSERIVAFQQEAEDRRRAFAQEAEDRAIKYQRDLADAQAQYVRELRQAQAAQLKATQQAAQAYQRDLVLAQQKYVTEVSLRQQAIRAELQTIQAGNAAKLQLENQYIQQSLNLLKSAVNSVTGGGSGGNAGRAGNGNRATGGLVAARQSVNVNERGISSGQESFSSGGKTVMLPGAGLFTPLQPGRVNANGGGASVSITNYITGGGDANAIAKAVDGRIETTLRRIFPAKGAA